MMQTREAPDFWGLHTNMNSVFPLNGLVNNHNFFLYGPVN